jgi:hypothetical protein
MRVASAALAFRDTFPPQLGRLDELDDSRLSRHGPVLAELSRVPALVPGTNAQTKRRHPRIISGESQNAKLNADSTNRIQKRSKWLQI